MRAKVYYYFVLTNGQNEVYIDPHSEKSVNKLVLQSINPNLQKPLTFFEIILLPICFGSAFIYVFHSLQS